MTAPAMTDTQRDQLAAALAAALALMYRATRETVRTTLGQSNHPVGTPRMPNAKITAFAADRAQKAQNGINSRLAAASRDPTDTAETRVQDMRGYNRETLVPFLASWASHAALVDTYQDTTDPANPGQSMAEAVQWQWDQVTEFDDECTAAAAASPAPLDELLAITSGPPPVHERCACTLSVA